MSKTVHGARAKVYIHDAKNPNGRPVGIWSHISFTVSMDVQPSFVLGRFTAAELTTTAVEPVSINAGGWRTIDHGVFVEAGVTNIKDLLTQASITMTVTDRQTGKVMAKIIGCLPTGYSQTLSARQLTEMNNSYMGLLASDESGDDTEAADAADLP